MFRRAARPRRISRSSSRSAQQSGSATLDMMTPTRRTHRNPRVRDHTPSEGIVARMQGATETPPLRGNFKLGNGTFGGTEYNLCQSYYKRRGQQ